MPSYAPVVPALLPALLLGLAAVLALPGCANMERERKASALQASTNAYREALRWGYWRAAVELLHPDARADLDLEPLENIRVTSLEVVRPMSITPDGKALRLVQIDYVLEDEQRVKRLLDRQDWRWDDSLAAWLLHSGLPAF